MKRTMWLLLAVVLVSGCGRNREMDTLKMENIQLQKKLAEAKAEAQKVADAKVKADAEAKKKVADAKAKVAAAKVSVVPTSTSMNGDCGPELSSLVVAEKKLEDVERLWFNSNADFVGQYNPAIERAKFDLKGAAEAYNASLNKARDCVRLIVLNASSPVSAVTITLGQKLFSAPTISYIFDTYGGKMGAKSSMRNMMVKLN